MLQKHRLGCRPVLQAHHEAEVGVVYRSLITLLLLDLFFEEHYQVWLNALGFEPTEPCHVEADLSL